LTGGNLSQTQLL